MMRVQEQRDVELRLLDGGVRTAVITGNNAAWQCICGRTKWLIGSTYFLDAIVKCPDCNREYKVIAEGDKKGATVDHVREY